VESPGIPNQHRGYPSWGKLLAINDTLFGEQPYDVVIFLDSDAYVNAFDIRIASMPQRPLTVWQDENRPKQGCAGVQIWRRGADAAALMEAWWGYSSTAWDNAGLFEQVVLQTQLHGRARFNAQITVLLSFGFRQDPRSDYSSKQAGWRSDVMLNAEGVGDGLVAGATAATAGVAVYIVHMWGNIKKHPFALDVLKEVAQRNHARIDDLAPPSQQHSRHAAQLRPLVVFGQTSGAKKEEEKGGATTAASSTQTGSREDTVRPLPDVAKTGAAAAGKSSGLFATAEWCANQKSKCVASVAVVMAETRELFPRKRSSSQALCAAINEQYANASGYHFRWCCAF
jgi:hypothetical protein